MKCRRGVVRGRNVPIQTHECNGVTAKWRYVADCHLSLARYFRFRSRHEDLPVVLRARLTWSNEPLSPGGRRWRHWAGKYGTYPRSTRGVVRRWWIKRRRSWEERNNRQKIDHFTPAIHWVTTSYLLQRTQQCGDDRTVGLGWIRFNVPPNTL